MVAERRIEAHTAERVPPGLRGDLFEASARRDGRRRRDAVRLARAVRAGQQFRRRQPAAAARQGERVLSPTGSASSRDNGRVAILRRAAGLLADEHFTGDGGRKQNAWASRVRSPRGAERMRSLQDAVPLPPLLARSIGNGLVGGGLQDCPLWGVRPRRWRARLPVLERLVEGGRLRGDGRGRRRSARRPRRVGCPPRTAARTRQSFGGSP